MPMLDLDEPALWYTLNRLMTDYWDDVDHNGGEHAHEFYLPDALYAVGNNRFEGTDNAQNARAIGVMSLYRADGRAPIRGMKPPR
jgi:hypothetical protein